MQTDHKDKKTDEYFDRTSVDEIYKHIDELLQQKKTVVVALEGGSASGKTTLAKELEQRYDCNVFHMDDFFLRPKQRTKERFKEPGGNVDRERFWEEVIVPLSKGEIVEYRRFDCSTFTLQPPVTIKPKRLTIVEGAYSTHPAFGRYYDFSVFLDIIPQVQKERILKRNGPEKMERFLKEWIPMEQKYFEVMDVKKRCDIIIDGDECSKERN